MLKLLKYFLREERNAVCVLLQDGDVMWMFETQAFSGQSILATGLYYRNHPLDDWELDPNSIDIITENVRLEE